ncbi:hypothetical protein IQ264_01285 [Phormidium sp. LEGE 05292]|uniref:hypothetical protein n=1 Tax=[Phormidium] sp. LEGE 05292 TaxID=767427 RepID=UPI00187DFD87|nr:hypothetical protein [Phormidium sp. LEGE 05292]MBE9224106.1 hypothetical protein [Phormidium sp. LEGE 05292]
MANNNNPGFGQLTVLYSGIQLANNLINTVFRRGERKTEFQRQTELQEQAHNYRLDEQSVASKHRIREISYAKKLEAKAQKKGHQHRLVEQEKAHEYRKVEQNEAHQQRLVEIGYRADREESIQAIAHHYRIEERGVDHIYRLREAEFSSELQLYLGLKFREIDYQHSTELEQLRNQNAVRTAAINRKLQRLEENSPFLDPVEYVVETLTEIYERNRQPLVLIAPFWDNTRTHNANDAGGFPDFRLAISVAWQKTQWFDGVTRCDGYISRPLLRGDRDIHFISAALANLPIILIHGAVQGGYRVHPAIAFWNLLPGQGETYSELNLDSFDVRSPKPGSNNKLEFEDFVAHYLASVVGILSDAHHLVLEGKRPDLRRYLSDEPEKLQLSAHQFCLYYDLLCYREPDREHFYRLDQALMLHECNLGKEAREQIAEALISWHYQKSQKHDLPDLALLFKLSHQGDLSFMTKLAETYQIIGEQDQAAQINQLVDDLKIPKFEPIDWFVYEK